MKQSWCGCSLQKGTKIISIVHLLVNVATGIYRSYQLSQIDFAGEYDGVKAFSCISNTVVSFALAMFSALLIDAAYSSHRQLLMPWLWATMLIACTRDFYMFIRSVFFASSGSLLGVIYVLAMATQITLGMYMWWVVYSFYHELKDKEKKALMLTKTQLCPISSDV